MRRASSSPPELAGYTYDRVLGSGGFSDVFLYEQQLPKRRVAVKVLLVDELTPANRAAFTAEANLMAQLSAHPYIVTIYQADVAKDGRPYFVMEYCAGPSLADRYKAQPLEVEDALRTGVRLASAVATAHGAGILHRDIKPGNVLSNAYGWPALTDFGISSAVDDGIVHTTTTTTTPAVDGTSSQSVGMSVPWSPPEMFGDDPQPDVRSDVFSLAATIWTVLAGRTPFEVPGRSNGALDLISRIERGAITPMERTDVPASLIAVLRKGMAVSADDRFATAIDFARALQRVELELGYAPTNLDVPNVAVGAPERAAGGSDDETRARPVSTITAQPAAPPSPAPVAEPTLLRGPVTVPAQPEAAPGPAESNEPVGETVLRSRTPAQETEAPVTSKRRVPVLGLVVGAIAVVVLAAVVTGVILSGGPGALLAAPSDTPSAPPVVLDTVPTPALDGDPTADSGTITIPVANPDPVDGDVFVWRISNRGESEGLHPVEGSAVVVEGFDGNPLCVEISVLRAGKTSAVPLEVCYPG